MISLPPYVPVDIAEDRIDFETISFRKATIHHGLRLWWEGACACPCRQIREIAGKTNETNESRGDCLGCAGTGILYDEGQQTVGMLHGTKEEQKAYNPFGPTAAGFVWITLLPENVPNYNDRFTLIDGYRIHSEWKKHIAVSESLRYPIQRRVVTIGSGVGLKTATTQTVGVLHCRVTDVNGVLLAGSRVEGADFVVNTTTGQIDWALGVALGTAPAIGAWFSARYFARPVFILQDHVYVRRDLHGRVDQVDLTLGAHPVNALCMAEHLGNKTPPIANFNPTPTFAMPG